MPTATSGPARAWTRSATSWRRRSAGSGKAVPTGRTPRAASAYGCRRLRRPLWACPYFLETADPQAGPGPRIMPTDSTLEPPRLDSARRTQPGRLRHVLYVQELNPSGRFPSLAEQALALAREFRDRSSLFLPAYLPTLDSDFVKRHVEAGVSVEELDLRTFHPATLRRLLRLIREYRIEIIHWNFYNPLINSYLWALSLLAPRLEHYYTDHISR